MEDSYYCPMCCVYNPIDCIHDNPLTEEEEENIEKDFGTIYLETNINQKEFNYYDAVKNIMAQDGYDTEYYDICSIKTEWKDEEVDIKFKFVNYSVNTISEEPYFKITFKEA